MTSQLMGLHPCPLGWQVATRTQAFRSDALALHPTAHGATAFMKAADYVGRCPCPGSLCFCLFLMSKVGLGMGLAGSGVKWRRPLLVQQTRVPWGWGTPPPLPTPILHLS